MKSATEEVDLVVERRVVSAARRVAAAITAVSITISTTTIAHQDSIIMVARKVRRVVSEARRGDITASTTMKNAT